MKGIELPINVMVIIVLVLIVLIALLTLFNSTWNSSQTGMTRETAKNNACGMLATLGCPDGTDKIFVKDFDANGNGRLNDAGDVAQWSTSICRTSAAGDNLATLCICQYGITSESECKKLCGCNS
jgi:hypothetical protein